MMIRDVMLLAAAGAAMAAGPARGQTPPAGAAFDPAQALGQCMVLKTTGSDRIVVARWLLAGLASAPQVADVATLVPGKKDEQDRAMAGLFTRLLTRDCPTEARAVFKLRSELGFQTAGEALGRVAMAELLGNRDAASALEAYVKYLRQEDFKAVVP